MYDITILTDRRYVDPVERNDYINNVLLEDKLLHLALEKKGLNVCRTNWDNADFNWATTRYAIFRTTWDYFDRYDEFVQWMKTVEKQTVLLNPKELIQWNIDKHYLGELSNKGINIPSTVFIEKGDHRSLESVIDETTWDEFILKPVISGAARNTFRIKRSEISDYELKFRTFISQESYMVQEFQQNILTQGEISLMVFGGKFSHAIRKIAKPGDFRVQDDFGGTVHHYDPEFEEIAFAEKVVEQIDPKPIYARIDVFTDNNGNPAIGEVELIEPELWFRMKDGSADLLANAIYSFIS